MAKPNVFFGGSSDKLLQAGSGYTDNGTGYTMLVKTDRVAFAGIGGECAFYNVYLPIEHDVAVTIRVTPIIDGVPLASQDFALTLPSARHIALLEVPLVQRFPSAIANYLTLAQFAPRGTWIQIQVETVGTGTGYVAVDGAEVEFDVTREGNKEGVNK